MSESQPKIVDGLTYDDVLLIPSYSEILPRETNVATHIGRGIELKIPLLSAAMDTVTEYMMAIAMAVEGGLGIIHKNMSIEQQADHVRRVKRYESGLIVDPITLQPFNTLREAAQVMREHRIGGVPIVNEAGALVGIITNRDIRFEQHDDRSLSDFMTKDRLITAPEGTTLEQAEDILRQHKIEKLPVVDGYGKLVGLITYKDILKRTHYPLASKDKLERLRVGAAVGITPDVLLRIDALVRAGVDAVAVDTAHAHSLGVLNTVRDIRAQFPDLPLIVGNVATAEATEAVIDAGADCVKVGIGPGSICTTRIIAGVGVPQLSAVIAASQAALKRGVPIIADGGIKYSGDIAKALAAGADAVMAGSLFAGTEESPGETIIYEGRKFKTYRGMGSLEAMQDGSKDRYFQDVEDDVKKLVPEGIVGRVPYKGKVSEILYQMVGGLRASMGYCGAPDLERLKNCRFVRITQAGLLESHPHSVAIVREAPNYSR